jgi:GNAT superfamily N-acetyltransferase
VPESGWSKTSQITVKKATLGDIKSLSKKLLGLLKDRRSEVYREMSPNSAYQKNMSIRHSEEELVSSAASGKSTFYLAFQGKQDIAGFAQIMHQEDKDSAELDRTIVFPQNTWKGIGTQLLTRIIKDQQRKGTKTIRVNTGKTEYHARQFYEKNGFILTKEVKKETPRVPS